MDSELQGVLGTAGGVKGRSTTARLQVTVEAVSTFTQVIGVSGVALKDQLLPTSNRRARRAAAAAAAKHSAGAAAAGARGEEELQAARLRAAVFRGYQAVSSAELEAAGVLYAAAIVHQGVAKSELAASERELRELVAEVQSELTGAEAAWAVVLLAEADADADDAAADRGLLGLLPEGEGDIWQGA